jgi:hypothetical protein
MARMSGGRMLSSELGPLLMMRYVLSNHESKSGTRLVQRPPIITAVLVRSLESHRDLMLCQQTSLADERALSY